MLTDYRELPDGERRKLRVFVNTSVSCTEKRVSQVSRDENRSVSSEEYKGKSSFTGVLIEAHGVSHT